MEFNDVRLRCESLREEIDAAISKVLNGGRYILGPSVDALEEDFARYCRCANGIALASGTDALTIGLRAVGIKAGDEVLVPAVSAPATAMAVALMGARPVFVDISPDNFNIDPALASERRTSRVKAIVPVHLYGMPAPLKEISRLGVPILEDAAQAHGSDASWGRCGSFGLAAAFSFYPTKNLGTYGDGGMLVTSDSAVAEKARLLRNYGQRENYYCEMVGHNSRLDEIHAAILRVALRQLNDWNRRRRAIAAIYREELKTLPITMQAEAGTSNYHIFALTVPERDKLRSHLAAEGIPTFIHYPVPLHRQKAFAEFSPARCPNADLLCSRVLSLPMHAFLTDGEVAHVIDGMRGFFNGRRERKSE